MHYDPNTKIYFVTDASNLGLGAILLHKENNGQLKVVAHTSRLLNRPPSTTINIWVLERQTSSYCESPAKIENHSFKLYI